MIHNPATRPIHRLKYHVTFVGLCDTHFNDFLLPSIFCTILNSSYLLLLELLQTMAKETTQVQSVLERSRVVTKTDSPKLLTWCAPIISTSYSIRSDPVFKEVYHNVVGTLSPLPSRDKKSIVLHCIASL